MPLDEHGHELLERRRQSPQNEPRFTIRWCEPLDFASAAFLSSVTYGLFQKIFRLLSLLRLGLLYSGLGYSDCYFRTQDIAGGCHIIYFMASPASKRSVCCTLLAWKDAAWRAAVLRFPHTARLFACFWLSLPPPRLHCACLGRLMRCRSAKRAGAAAASAGFSRHCRGIKISIYEAMIPGWLWRHGAISSRTGCCLAHIAARSAAYYRDCRVVWFSFLRLTVYLLLGFLYF